jgi:hypothetical protein
MTKRMHVLNLGSMAEASIAEGRLTKVRNELTKTLNELDKNTARWGQKKQ